MCKCNKILQANHEKPNSQECEMREEWGLNCDIKIGLLPFTPFKYWKWMPFGIENPGVEGDQIIVGTQKVEIFQGFC